MPAIGLLNEQPLHASLKHWYARPGDRCEAAVDGFVIDLVRDGLLIEIQTGSFASIKPKLLTLIQSHQVRLIHPIVQQTWIVRPAAGDQGPLVRRRSPRRGRVEDLFHELVSIPRLLSNPNFSLEVLMIEAEETRRFEGRRQWRRGGWAVDARRLLAVVDRLIFTAPSDWRGLLPGGLDAFTTGDLAAALRVSRDLAQKMAYCLRQGGVIELVGNRGRSRLYRAPA